MNKYISNTIKIIKKYDERLKLKNKYNENDITFDKQQDNISTIKQTYIKNCMNLISENKLETSFNIYMLYNPNGDVIGNNLFCVKIANDISGEIFKTTFKPKVIYFGFDIFEYLIRYFCKVNHDKIEKTHYNNDKNLFVVKAGNVTLKAQIPSRYLETVNSICETKCKKLNRRY